MQRLYVLYAANENQQVHSATISLQVTFIGVNGSVNGIAQVLIKGKVNMAIGQSPLLKATAQLRVTWP